MDNMEAQAQWAIASRLFREGRFEEALRELTILRSFYPSERHVLHALAKCLLQLNRHYEALSIYDELIGRYDEPATIELRDRLRAALSAAQMQRAESRPSLISIPEFMDLEEIRPAPGPPPMQANTMDLGFAESVRAWPTLRLVFTVAAVLFGVGVLLLALNPANPVLHETALLFATAALGLGLLSCPFFYEHDWGEVCVEVGLYLAFSALLGAALMWGVVATHPVAAPAEIPTVLGTLQSAVLFSLLALVQAVLSVAVFRAVLWVWEDGGFILYTVGICTIGGFFVLLLLARVLRGFAQWVTDSMTA